MSQRIVAAGVVAPPPSSRSSSDVGVAAPRREIAQLPISQFPDMRVHVPNEILRLEEADAFLGHVARHSRQSFHLLFSFVVHQIILDAFPFIVEFKFPRVYFICHSLIVHPTPEYGIILGDDPPHPMMILLVLVALGSVTDVVDADP